jgi:three-Cys-motif partner protein
MADTDPLADAPDDRLFTQEVGPWAEDKLAVVARYLQGFAVASRRARRWYLVDGFAGPGVFTLRGTGRRVPGTPLSGLRVEPQARRCVMLERNRIAAEALRTRTAEFGDRAVVEHGNANADLVPLIYTHVARSQPCLCVLDPEGSPLEWATVAAIADFKRGLPHKLEQLLLLPLDAGFVHDLSVRDDPPGAVEREARAIFGNDRWRTIYDRRRRGALATDRARAGYVKLYGQRLRELGYRQVLGRPIHRHGRTGAPLYFLLLATDDDRARRILDQCFETVFGPPAEGPPGPAPRERTTPRRGTRPS